MTTILSLVISNWKYVLVGLVVAALVGGAVWKFEEWRMDKLRSEVIVLRASNESMQEKIKKDADTCKKRLDSKDQLINELNNIDGMEGHNETSGTNPLRDALNRMWN